MLKIGDFSKLAHVTVKTLRYYAQIGLLKPAWIDRFTGYRYYSLEQMPRLNRILALKNLGFSLQQISSLMDEKLSVEQLQGMVRLKQAELHRLIEAEQIRLSQVEARLKWIEHEGSLPRYDVALKRIPPQPIASVRARIDTIHGLPERCRQMEAEVREWLRAGDIRSNGPWMVLYYNPEYTEKDIEVEVAVSIEPAPGGTVPWPGNASGLTKVSGLTNVSQRTLVGVETMACVTHLSEQAGPADIYEAYTAFYQWTENNLFRLCGPVRELYLIEDRLTAQKPSERAGELIEVQFPVEPSALFRKETFMQPEIKTYPAFKVAGVRYHGKNENQEIAQMWDKELLPRFHEVKRVNSNEAFGVCGAEMDPDGSFTYVAGGQIKDPADVPPGMILYEVPEALYAVFPVKGAADKLGETYGYIYQSWLPQSGYKRAMTPDFEYYGPEFNGFAEDSVLYLYVPIQKA